MSKPSGWLQVVCIIAIILGVLGVGTSLYSTAILVTGQTFQAGLATPAQQQIRQEMKQEVQKIADRWLPVTIPLLVVNLLVSICMIFGAIQTLRMRPSGRGFLVGVFFVAIIFMMFQTVPTIAMQNEMRPVVSEYMPKLMDASMSDGQAMPAQAEAAVIVGLVFGIGTKLLELAFYIFGFIYLRRPNVKERFAEPADAQLV